MQASVVVASIVGPPFLDNCLSSLEGQARRLGAEVIVVACGPDAFAARIGRAFPWVRLLHRRERETVPELRRRGVLEARGQIVAIIEEHCVAEPNWLEVALGGLEDGRYGAVGGPVVDNGYRRLRDWVVYFCEYNGYLPPFAPGETQVLNGANIAYRRQLLLRHQHLLGQGYWEATLHPELLAQGVKFGSLPQMWVRHCGPFDFGYYLRQRYWFSRAFAGARAQKLPASRRAAYVAAAPVIPALLLARMASRVFAKRCRVGRFLASSPLIAVALLAYVAGEWVGYLAGPGDALLKVE
jgi:glycosyltransferase involved in cell wall biosynthesis